jgi:hypothetical protein
MQVNFNECYFCGLTSTAVIEKSAYVSANAYSAHVMTWHNYQITSQYNYTEQGNMTEVLKINAFHTVIKPKQWLPSALLNKNKILLEKVTCEELLMKQTT